MGFGSLIVQRPLGQTSNFDRVSYDSYGAD